MANTKKVIGIIAAAVGATYVGLSIAAKRKKFESIYDNKPEEKNPLEGKKVEFVADESEKENADGVRGHLIAVGDEKREPGTYEKYIKRGLDKTLSFGGLVLLSPILGAIALAIKIEDPGPALFVQKRVGQNKQYFKLHKFRSMRMDTPHDVPTHMLENPDQYITKVGRFIRKHSLDELAQIWDIFIGNMSVIGPRPALWNQDLLIAERDRYGANNVKPGLTGWAQINGRDELEIPDKAKLDGEYVKNIGPKMDAKCFLGSVHVFSKDDSVVEGGTGELHHNSSLRSGVPELDPEENFACDYQFNIDHSTHKNVLIVGSGSYIGESFKLYAEKYYSHNFTFTTVDTMPGEDGKSELDLLSTEELSEFDIVYHLAGIAHADVGNVDDATKEKYYKVNTDLAITTAIRCKEAGVRTFAFMSSMIVYGDSAPYGTERVIDKTTIPAPANFYGDSKWQADKGLRNLADGKFKVVIIRPPMIYGKGSKGNYPTLSKLAKKLLVFPDVSNSRSMLYIENLCEFLCQMMISTVSSTVEAPASLVFIPQNPTYTKTSDMVRMIAEAAGKKINVARVLNPAVTLADHVPGKVKGLVDKAFGNNAYDQELSRYEGLDYQRVGLEESVKRTEGVAPVLNKNKTPHILLISQYFYPEQFRVNDMAMEWVKRGYKVTVLTGIPNYPMGKYFEGYDLKHHRHEMWNGVEVIRIPLIARGNSSNKLLNVAGMTANYLSFVASGKRWVKSEQAAKLNADLVFTFEVSPMTQALIGIWYGKKYHVPTYLYVQDLWPENVETVTGIHSKAVIAPINSMVDKIYRDTDVIFTTSPSFVDAIVNRDVKVDVKKVHYWPQYAEEFYKPMDKAETEVTLEKARINLKKGDNFKIAFTGNIGYAQGLDIIPKTAVLLKGKGVKDVQFVIVGDGRYQSELEDEIRSLGVEEYFIMIPRQNPETIPAILACCDAAFLSFMDTELFAKTIPAKLQSYMACGMPILAAAKGETERVIRESGCGLCCEIGDSVKMAESVVRMQEMKSVDSETLKEMSSKAREYFENHFDKKMLMDQMDEYFR